METKIMIRLCVTCRECSKCCPAQIDISEAFEIYGEYLSGEVQILKKLNRMRSVGKPVDCIECGACSSHCPYSLDAKELMRELAMMQSCEMLISFPYSIKARR